MRRTLGGAGAAVILATVSLAFAQPSVRRGASPAPVAAPSSSVPTNLRARVGADNVARLLQSSEEGERIRGIERAGTLATADAVAALAGAAEANPRVRGDSRALVAVARALAPFATEDRARTALLLIVSSGTNGIAGRLPTARFDGDTSDPTARLELARQIAALAIARAGAPKGLEALYAAARSGTAGQAAALNALIAYPPEEAGFYGTPGPALTPPVLRAIAKIGDLRALDAIALAGKSSDVGVRSAALAAQAELGDRRAIAVAKAMIAESDARLRAAAGEALVVLGAAERFQAVAALTRDDATAAIGIRLAERASSPEIVQLLATRAAANTDPELRAAAIRALGRATDDRATKALVAAANGADRTVAYDAALALARSPARDATARLADITARPLGMRAYVVRALLRGERSSAMDRVLGELRGSARASDRALAAFSEVALGEASASRFLADVDPRIRRAAATGALAHPSRAVLARLPGEPDAITRQVLASGLAYDDGTALTTSLLTLRADAGEADAALAARALAARAEDGDAARVDRLLAAHDAVLRAHVATGIAASRLHDASGRLAEAYAFETDTEARRAIVAALARREADASSPSRQTTLANAAALDPDGRVREIARRALAGEIGDANADATEVAWLRITTEDGAAPPSSYVASLVRPDGVAVPFAFDEDGFAVIPGLEPGPVRLILAPRLPTYEAPSQ